jgi:hypothetical protein
MLYRALLHRHRHCPRDFVMGHFRLGCRICRQRFRVNCALCEFEDSCWHMDTEAQASTLAAQIRASLNGQTAIIPWRELQRFFAGGLTILVDNQLNLLDVAVKFAQDDSRSLQPMLSQGLVVKVSDDQAEQWLQADIELWSVVVAPWVLVQAKVAES